jgi:hypothetical protein
MGRICSSHGAKMSVRIILVENPEGKRTFRMHRRA